MSTLFRTGQKNYKKLSILFLFTILLPISSFSKELQEQTVLDGKIKISIPKGLSLMDDKMRALKYSDEDAPKEAYTNEGNTVDIVIGGKDKEGKIDLEETKQFYSWIFKSLNPELTITNINNADILRVSFILQALGTEFHNYMAFIPYPDESGFAVINCNMEKDVFLEWSETCEKVIQSIKVLK